MINTIFEILLFIAAIPFYLAIYGFFFVFFGWPIWVPIALYIDYKRKLNSK
jgi:hypothetical protein